MNLPRKIGGPVSMVFKIDDESFFAVNGNTGLRIDNILGQPIAFYNFCYKFPEYGVSIKRDFGKYYIGKTEVTEEEAYQKLNIYFKKREEDAKKPPEKPSQPGE